MPHSLRLGMRPSKGDGVSKGRLEAFSDGVVAILITIMVLELHAPSGSDLESLRPLAPVFLAYVLSFVNLGLYWNNHHHLFQSVSIVDGRVLWANLGLLFSLSLFPFVTAWMGQNALSPVPTAAYGVVFLMAAIAYFLLVRALLHVRGQCQALASAIGDDRKGKLSALVYVAAVPIALVAPAVAIACFVAVAIVWLVPDRRIERVLASNAEGGAEPEATTPHEG